MNSYKVISKERYHMYALGEIVTRVGLAYNFIVDGYEYINEKGIRQHLPENHVVLVDKNTKEV